MPQGIARRPNNHAGFSPGADVIGIHSIHHIRCLSLGFMQSCPMVIRNLRLPSHARKSGIYASSDLLATNLPLLPCRPQLPVAFGVGLLLATSQHTSGAM